MWHRVNAPLAAMQLPDPSNQEQLVARLLSLTGLKGELSVRTADALRTVDRRYFCGARQARYLDQPTQLSYGLTFPALETLEEALGPGGTALDVGTGSGYIAACLALLAGRSGTVIAIDHVPELAGEARINFDEWKAGMRATYAAQATFLLRDGRHGYKRGAKYDAIYVGAAVQSFPCAMFAQLKDWGRMVVPIFHGEKQVLTVVDKLPDGSPRVREVCEVRFARLEGRPEQLARWLNDKGASIGTMPHAGRVKQEPIYSWCSCGNDDKSKSPPPD